MTDPDLEGLTARVRIRDAAVQHIGGYGFEPATIRGSVCVSWGLVRHHFGCRHELREACDVLLPALNERTDPATRIPGLPRAWPGPEAHGACPGGGRSPVLSPEEAFEARAAFGKRYAGPAEANPGTPLSELEEHDDD